MRSVVYFCGIRTAAQGAPPEPDGTDTVLRRPLFSSPYTPSWTARSAPPGPPLAGHQTKGRPPLTVLPSLRAQDQRQGPAHHRS